MKKTLAVLAICALFASMSLAAAIPQQQLRVERTEANAYKTMEKRDVTWTGEFDGQFGVGRGDNHTVLGDIEGHYKSRMHNRIRGFFKGNWTSADGNNSGTIRGIFSKRGIVGSISGDGYNRTMKYIGLFRYNDSKFIGRIMGWVGPAVYIYGDHWKL